MGANSFSIFLDRTKKTLNELFFPDIPVCVYCTEELREGTVCLDCERALEPYRIQKQLRYPNFIARSPFCYDDLTQHLIHQFKFEDARYLADYMADCMAGAVDGARYDVIAPIPLHKKRKRSRGYNQAELLAEALAVRMGKPLEALLARGRNTYPQSKLNRTEREKNVQGAFDLAPHANVGDMRILLVDDVITIGATMGVCVEVLKGYGASLVEGISFAAVL